MKCNAQAVYMKTRFQINDSAYVFHRINLLGGVCRCQREVFSTISMLVCTYMTYFSCRFYHQLVHSCQIDKNKTQEIINK
jgi:hypothetical protein